jgi:hypothetical protein
MSAAPDTSNTVPAGPEPRAGHDEAFAAAAATGTGTVYINGRRFCQACQLYSCDHVLDLDFEWTPEDHAELLALPLGLDDDDETPSAADARPPTDSSASSDA